MRSTESDIPSLGLGTWDLRSDECTRTVREALEMGYRHIDTAQMYENETEVGRGLREASVPRESVFLTTKLWTNNLTASAVQSSTQDSLRRLAADYVDLLLIHWPSGDVPLSQTLEAMDSLRERGLARAIGVSNFPPSMWAEALDIAPATVNQVECHPYLSQRALRAFARERDLDLVAYTPLAKGRVAEDTRILEIATAHEKTAGQVCLRWLTQHPRVAAIPKARGKHLSENLASLDFELTEDEMQVMSGLDRGERLVNPPWAPDWTA